jgi:ketosteroid isomerase-like protein
VPPEEGASRDGGTVERALFAGVLVRALISLVVCLLGCATAPASGPPRTTAAVGIEEGNRIFTAAVLVGNPDRVATAFTDDATILPFRLPGTVKGHAAIAEYWRKRLSTTRFLELEVTTSSIDTSGDLAYEIGTNRSRTQVGDSAPVNATGRYLVVWRRGADGVWRIQADCPIPDPPPEQPKLQP